jgi:chromosome segregation ATPase
MNENNNITLSTQISSIINQQFKLININDWNKLENENIEYKKRISELTDDKTILQNIILNKDKSIEELQKENNELKKRIELLENNIIELKNENKELKNDIIELKNESKGFKNDIIELRNENKELKNENKELKNENKELKNDINEIKNEKIFNKYIIAIQDANRYLKFNEKTLNVDTLNDLNELKYNRIESCHYLDNNYDEDRKKEYLNSLYEKITNITPEIKQMFDDTYPSLLSEIAPIINSNSFKTTKYTKYLNMWWK